MKQFGVVARAKDLKTALSALLHPALFEFLLCEVGKLLIVPDSTFTAMKQESRYGVMQVNGAHASIPGT